jgi:hypothetical protein
MHDQFDVPILLDRRRRQFRCFSGAAVAELVPNLSADAQSSKLSTGTT